MSDEGNAVAPLDTAVTPFPGVAWVARRPFGVVGQLSLLTTYGTAEALLEGMKKIKEEVTTSGTLNKAHIPMRTGTRIRAAGSR